MGRSKNSKNFTEAEDFLLLKHYPSDSWEKLEKIFLNRSKRVIQYRASKLGIKRNSVFTEVDDEMLRKHFATSTKKELLQLFPSHQNFNVIRNRALKIGLTRCGTIWQRRGTLKPLLDNSLESYYWAGFIAADGYFRHKGNHMIIALKITDMEHLLKLANFLNTKIRKIYTGKEKEQVVLSVRDQDYAQSVIKKFDYKHQKTKNPPYIEILENFSDLQLTSYIIGFIDGDGSFILNNKKDYILRIQCHRSWFEILKLMAIHLCQSVCAGNYQGITKIDYKGYANMAIYKQDVIFAIKKYIDTLNLPILQRKWSKLNG